MDVGLGIERRHYLEREDCGDETNCGCEDMHHVHLLLGLKEGVCLYMGFVLADVSPCSGLALGQKGLGVTEEDETVDGVEGEVRRKQWIREQWAPMSKCDARWPIPLCLAVQQRYRNVWKWEVDYIESLVNQDSAQDHALMGVRRRHWKGRRKTSSHSSTTRYLTCHAHCSRHTASLDLTME